MGGGGGGGCRGESAMTGAQGTKVMGGELRDTVYSACLLQEVFQY